MGIISLKQKVYVSQPREQRGGSRSGNISGFGASRKNKENVFCCGSSCSDSDNSSSRESARGSGSADKMKSDDSGRITPTRDLGQVTEDGCRDPLTGTVDGWRRGGGGGRGGHGGR